MIWSLNKVAILTLHNGIEIACLKCSRAYKLHTFSSLRDDDITELCTLLLKGYSDYLFALVTFKYFHNNGIFVFLKPYIHLTTLAVCLYVFY